MNKEDFFNNIRKTVSCWIWEGNIQYNGYGQLSYKNKHWMAHRLSYVFHKGKIPKNKVIDHLCRNRCCVNPEHLEVVSITENLMRGNTIAVIKSNWTHCMRGHILSGDNLYITPKGRRRSCKTCRKASSEKHKRKKPHIFIYK